MGNRVYKISWEGKVYGTSTVIAKNLKEARVKAIETPLVEQDFNWDNDLPEELKVSTVEYDYTDDGDWGWSIS